MENSSPVSVSYNGRLYIEIPTDKIFSDTNTVNILNDVSDGIINKDGSELTIWSFNSYGNAFKVIIELQNKKCPFRLLGENDLLFIASEY